MNQTWINAALEVGFSNAATLDTKTLKPMEMVRDMCASDKCHAYNRNWTCPPNCGTLEECAQQISLFTSGIILQTVGHLTKTIDSKTILLTETIHKQHFLQFCELVRKEYPNALCLGTGGCSICAKCAYPKPCHFPDKAYSSMEAYGLFVTQICRDNHMKYHHGDKTITFTSCILFS